MNPRETAVSPEAALVAVHCDQDIVTARMLGRSQASALGFAPVAATLIATAISELARNILLYAGSGEITIEPIEHDGCVGLLIQARDRGPGIPEIPRAMQDGYSTSGRLGLGLPGVRRLMDDFEIWSKAGEGTCVRTKKWNR